MASAYRPLSCKRRSSTTWWCGGWWQFSSWHRKEAIFEHHSCYCLIWPYYKYISPWLNVTNILAPFLHILLKREATDCPSFGSYTRCNATRLYVFCYFWLHKLHCKLQFAAWLNTSSNELNIKPNDFFHRITIHFFKH